MAEYKVKFEVFEGPLDLLLYLIKKEEVDIYDVNLTLLATQFIEHIETMRLLDLEIAGEFLVMAATLMYIKSRERPSMKFSELFEGVTSRSEVVVTFLALLELIRLKQIVAIQAEPFGEIEIACPAPAANASQPADLTAAAPHP